MDFLTFLSSIINSFLTFFSNMIDSLVWPGLLFAVFWLFRKPIGGLIDAVSSAKLSYQKGEASIEAELGTIREKVPGLPQKEPPEDLKKMAQSQPVQAIERSWKELESSATAATSCISAPPSSPFELADELMERKILIPAEAEAFYKMHEIKEKATKPGSGFVTDVSSATSYSSLASGLSEKIQSARHVKAQSTTATGHIIKRNKENGEES